MHVYTSLCMGYSMKEEKKIPKRKREVGELVRFSKMQREGGNEEKVTPNALQTRRKFAQPLLLLLDTAKAFSFLPSGD